MSKISYSSSPALSRLQPVKRTEAVTQHYEARRSALHDENLQHAKFAYGLHA